MKHIVAVLSLVIGALLTGCGPSPAEIRAEQAKVAAEKNLREAQATARLDAFRAETKAKAEEEKSRVAQQEVDRVLAPYVKQERLERANAAHKREYIRRGNELADREGQ